MKISNSEDLEDRLTESFWLIQKSENLNLGKNEKKVKWVAPEALFDQNFSKNKYPKVA